MKFKPGDIVIVKDVTYYSKEWKKILGSRLRVLNIANGYSESIWVEGIDEISKFPCNPFRTSEDSLELMCTIEKTKKIGSQI